MYSSDVKKCAQQIIKESFADILIGEFQIPSQKQMESYLLENIDYSFENPNFNFFEFRQNLVARWEYIPGSTIYVVWSQGRTGDNSFGEFNFRRDFNQLYSIVPHNIFLIKVSYRISV